MVPRQEECRTLWALDRALRPPPDEDDEEEEDGVALLPADPIWHRI